MELRDVSLDDRWRIDAEPVLLSGPQALVRLLLTQRELDRREGLATGGFVSGYRGSPLGGLDLALWKASRRLEQANVVFNPGVNEELAATSVWGTQQLRIVEDPTVEGIFAMWYGKGPGVDRAGDPIKHGNYTGTHPKGGVLAVFGDDHPGKSSTIAHHSEQAMAANSVPVLYPSGVGEFVRFGLLGWAMSRYSGCWVGMKVVNETVEQTATVAFDLDAFSVERPDASDLTPAEGVHFRGAFAPLQDESALVRARLPRVHRFARANRIDRTSLGGAGRFGIVTAGKAHQDVMQALRYLGIDEARARELGVAVRQVGLIWPLEPEGLREFAAGRDELMFVEEKAAFMEPQAAAILYNAPARPRIVGKFDDAGGALLPQELQLEPIDVAMAIAARLRANGIGDAALEERVRASRAWRGVMLSIAPTGAKRLPFFCSGCPHNTSTAVPEGSFAISGIGCHGMALWAKPGTTMLGTQMGGEGMNWVGLSRFTGTRHVFQNLGDGTYFHSGVLAIRAAVASGANITYKILYNDAVAMTGGQPHDGTISPVALAHQVVHEGVKRLVLVTDDPDRYRDATLPAGVRVEHRDALDAVQRELREVPGCTAILYEQTCAAEKRRRRKRGRFPDPEKRVYINDAVCEGCGDCSAQSGCTSIQPLETPLGRKRRIDQSTCNKDYSCVKGFCPSFVTVLGGRPRRPASLGLDALPALPEPPVAPLPPEGFGVMISGIGGTGVITVGAVLAMAAHLERRAASAYDMTGLSQKNGAVYSHLRIAPSADAIASQRLGLGEASLALAFDMVAALGDEAYRTLDRERSRFVGNERVQPTASLNFDPDDRVDTGLLRRKVRERLDESRVAWVDASGLATAACGDSMATNLFMLGVAAQRGWLPVGVAAIERAVELNDVQVDMNRRAFAFGRLWVHDPARLEAMLGERAPARAGEGEPPQELAALVAQRAAHLAAWQDARWARRYEATVARVAAAERAAVPGSDALAKAVARSLSKLMSYKDEYEVARLYADPSFLARISAEFEGEPRLAFNLAPPMFAKRDPATGRMLKREYGGWMLGAFRVLARLRRLRGTVLDPFGRTEERRTERALIAEYERDLDRVVVSLDADRHALAIEIASLPEGVRGFGHVKDANVARYRQAREALLARWEGGPAPRELTRDRVAA